MKPPVLMLAALSGLALWSFVICEIFDLLRAVSGGGKHVDYLALVIPISITAICGCFIGLRFVERSPGGKWACLLMVLPIAIPGLLIGISLACGAVAAVERINGSPLEILFGSWLVFTGECALLHFAGGFLRKYTPTSQIPSLG